MDDLQGLYREARRVALSYNIAAFACIAKRLWLLMFASPSAPMMKDFTVFFVRNSFGNGRCVVIIPVSNGAEGRG